MQLDNVISTLCRVMSVSRRDQKENTYGHVGLSSHKDLRAPKLHAISSRGDSNAVVGGIYIKFAISASCSDLQESSGTC